MPILYLLFILSQRLVLATAMQNNLGGVLLYMFLSAAFDHAVIKLSRMRTLVKGSDTFEGSTFSLCGSVPAMAVGLTLGAVLELEQGYLLTIVMVAMCSCLLALYCLFTEEEAFRESHEKRCANAIAGGTEADARMMCEIHGVSSFRQVLAHRRENDHRWYERHMNQLIKATAEPVKEAS